MPKVADDKIMDLSSRRFQKIAEENSALKTYVAEVMQRLRQNERLFSRLFELESQVLKATDPEDLCFTLLRSLRSGFDVDIVRFWLDRSSFMGGHRLDGLSERDLVWVEKDEISAMGVARKPVWLIQLSSENPFVWLQPQDSHLGSLALLTLGHPEHPFGVLGLGSIDRDRFSPDQSSDFLQHLAQVIGLTMEHAVAQERLARLSVSDVVTGSRNRRFLQPHSHQPMSQWFGPNVAVACLYLDIDSFRAYVERAGDEEANHALKAVCDTMHQFVRGSDPLVRMEGDEFALFMPGICAKKAEGVADRIVKAVAYSTQEKGKLTISMGVAFSQAGQDLTVKALIALADQAMYVAKALGGNRFEFSGNQADEG
ncbi:MAG: DUF484 family protein [Mariprofundus sp.]|nr:DUF484 family protein [Mariprofundus sp.]